MVVMDFQQNAPTPDQGDWKHDEVRQNSLAGFELGTEDKHLFKAVIFFVDGVRKYEVKDVQSGETIYKFSMNPGDKQGAMIDAVTGKIIISIVHDWKYHYSLHGNGM
jgi:hypothetical protein